MRWGWECIVLTLVLFLYVSWVTESENAQLKQIKIVYQQIPVQVEIKQMLQ